MYGYRNFAAIVKLFDDEDQKQDVLYDLDTYLIWPGLRHCSDTAKTDCKFTFHGMQYVEMQTPKHCGTLDGHDRQRVSAVYIAGSFIAQ